jgi:hypothetical protein
MDKVTENEQVTPQHKGKFVKGMSGNKFGRPKGKKNKKNELLDAFMDRVLDGGITKFEEEMNKLSGKGYVDTFMAFMEFKRGKIARTELATADGSTIDVKQVFLFGGKEITF